MITNMIPSYPTPSIMTIPEIAAARAASGMVGLGVADDYGGTTGTEWDYNGGSGSQFGFDAAGNTIVNPGPVIQGGIATPPVITPSGTPVNSTGINWNALIGQGFNLTKQIIQTQPGVYTQQGPNGTITYRQPLANQSNLPFSAGGGLPSIVGTTLGGTLNSSTIMLIAAAGIGAMLLLGRR